MKREELMRVYEPKENLEMRVKNVLGKLEERPVRSMRTERIVVLAVCMVMLVATAVAGATGLLFSNEYDAVRLANRALAEEYGIT